MTRLPIFVLIAWLLAAWPAQASIVWTYDFPGTPGSSLGNGQTNPQIGNATFGNWSRVNVSAVGTANVLDSNLWNTTSTFDSTQYVTFTITAAAGYHLNLSLLTFDESRTAGGPTKGLVNMYLNGSATVYDSLSYNPSSSVQNKSFNFTPTVDADNVTSVEFRFYGWNGGTPAASLILDNVAVTIAVVHEATTLGPIVLLLGVISLADRGLRKRKPVAD